MLIADESGILANCLLQRFKLETGIGQVRITVISVKIHAAV
jgi:hypothetical protein